MSRLHDIKTGKKKKHSCDMAKSDLWIREGVVLNQRSRRNK